MMRSLHSGNTSKRQWLLLLACLLLLNQWTAAFAGNMSLPPVAPHTSMTLAMNHMQMNQTQMPDCDLAPSHCTQMQMNHASNPTPPDHCSNPAACQLCHATPALLSLDTPTIIRTANFTPPLLPPFYLSVVHATLDRPPASLLA